MDNDQKFNELLGWLLETVKGSTEFVKEQAPEVARDMIRFGFWGNLVACVACGILLAIFIAVVVIAAKRCIKHVKSGGDPDPVYMFGIFGGVFASAVVALLCATMATSGRTAMKAGLAPRLYVLEQCATMLRK